MYAVFLFYLRSDGAVVDSHDEIVARVEEKWIVVDLKLFYIRAVPVAISKLSLVKVVELS